MAKLDAAHEDTEEAPILDEVSALLKQVSVGTPCRGLSGCVAPLASSNLTHARGDGMHCSPLDDCSALRFDGTGLHCALRCVAVHVALHRNPSQAILHSDEKHPPSLHLMATLCERRAELRQCEACLRCEPPRALHRHRSGACACGDWDSV